jgi:hypothetical protein
LFASTISPVSGEISIIIAPFSSNIARYCLSDSAILSVASRARRVATQKTRRRRIRRRVTRSGPRRARATSAAQSWAAMSMPRIIRIPPGPTVCIGTMALTQTPHVSRSGPSTNSFPLSKAATRAGLAES